MTHTARALQSHDLSGKGIKLWITDILFWPHKDMEGLPGWVISPMPGPPPREHKHERQYTPSTQSVIPRRRIWNDDYDGQMTFGVLGGPKVSSHLSYRWGRTPKKPHPGNLSRPGIELGPAAWQARMLPLAPQRWTIQMNNLLILGYFQSKPTHYISIQDQILRYSSMLDISRILWKWHHKYGPIFLIITKIKELDNM